MRSFVLKLAWLLVLAQFVGLLLWSWHEVDRASLTWDFANYFQPWYQIAHGHLLPRNTFQGGYYFFQNDGEFLVYLLAPLYWIFPNHMVGYLWLQDAAIAGASAVCLRWVTQLVEWRPDANRRQQAIASLCWLMTAAFLVLNPWTYWVASFDIHMEPFAILFVLLGLRALLARRRTVAVWFVLTLMCGAASTLFALGAGCTALVAIWWARRRPESDGLGLILPVGGRGSHSPGKSSRTGTSSRSGWREYAPALIVSAVAAAWLPLLDVLGATKGSPSQGYAYLIKGYPPNGHPSVLRVMLAAIEHPAEPLRVIATHGWNIWANISPDGLFGILSVAGFFMSVPTLLVNNLLKIQGFSYPSFQNYVMYPFIALGSVGIVALLLRRRRLWPLGCVLAAVMMINLGGWFSTWFFTTANRWVLIDPTAAALVKSVAHDASAQDEVVSSQGFIGLFAGRRDVYSLSGPVIVPVRSKTIWFVFSASQGIETANQDETVHAVTQVQMLPGAQMLDSTDGVWVLRWHPPRGWRTVRLAVPGDPTPAWLTPGSAGRSVTAGPPISWHVTSTGAAGSVLANDYWPEQPGRYVARISYVASAPVTLGVWNQSTQTMITSRLVQGGGVRRSASIIFTLSGGPPPVAGPAGSGLFRFAAIPASSVPTVSVVVGNPSRARVSVWWESVGPVRR